MGVLGLHRFSLVGWYPLLPASAGIFLPVQRRSLTLDKVLLEFFEIFWAVFVPEATGGVSGNYRDMTGFCTGFDKNGDYGYGTVFIAEWAGPASIGLVGVRWGRR
jgi:hypothetical protein